MTQELYSWQMECVDTWMENDCHGIVNAVTGSGKTWVALECIRRLNRSAGSKLRVKIVVPGKSLLLQWKHSLEKILFQPSGAEIGLYGGTYRTSVEKKYMIYVIHSARYRLARQILKELQEGYTVFLIADECHNYTGSENRKIFEFLPLLPKLSGTYCSLGLSATAAKPGFDTILIPALGREIYHYDLEHALKKRTVCDFAVWQIAVNFQPEEQQEYDELSEALHHTRLELLRLFPVLKFYEGAAFFAQLQEISGNAGGKAAQLAKTYLQLTYKRKRTVHMAASRISCAYRLLMELGLQKQVLIFGESIAQIEQLYDTLNRTFPSRVGRYHSKMGSLANKNALNRFRNGELRILLTCRALDEGIDVPEAAIGIILSGTSMERQRLQRLGRILRKHDGKRMACLYYLFIAGSREEHAYFQRNLDCFQIQDLFFDEKNGQFHFPAYEASADAVLSDPAVLKLPEQIRMEIQACLHQGYLREDWLLPPEECHQSAIRSATIHEQNYWLCMEQMARKKK